MIAAFCGPPLQAARLYAAEPAALDPTTELTRKLQNPVSDLIALPIQENWDFGIGKVNAHRHTINIEPVIPFSLGTDLNLITRTILPVIYLEPPLRRGVEPESGLGDILQSFFFSPKRKIHGWIIGAGPVFLYPSSTNAVPLGSEKFGLGPTLAVLRQDEGLTYGILTDHIWSVAGNSDRKEYNATYVQPFVSYSTRTHTTFGLNTESTYDWEAKQWTAPLNASVSQILKIGKFPISIGLGGGYYLDSPAGGPDWKLRFTVTFLFPEKKAA